MSPLVVTVSVTPNKGTTLNRGVSEKGDPIVRDKHPFPQPPSKIFNKNPIGGSREHISHSKSDSPRKKKTL